MSPVDREQCSTDGRGIARGTVRERAFEACTVVACRECCERTECDLSALPGVRFTGCLGPCRYPNVLVVRPSRDARRRGVRPLWLGLLAHPAAIAALARWLLTGGPGAAAVPYVVLRHEIARPVRRR